MGSGFRQQWLRQLASLASANGYQQIKHAGSADADTAKDFLLKVRPPKYYHLEGNRLRRKMQLICQVLEDIEKVKTHTMCPEVTSDYDDCGSEIEDRCGRPQEHSVKKDEKNPFLNHIYFESLAITPKKYMTSFACKRDSFHFFFGTAEHGVKSPQTSEEDSNGDLDGNVREVDDVHRKADLPATISEGGDETEPNLSILPSTSKENSLQLVDTYSISPADIPPKTNKKLGQIIE